MGHTKKMGYVLKKWLTIEKLVILNKIDNVWSNLCSRLKKLSNFEKAFVEMRHTCENYLRLEK